MISYLYSHLRMLRTAYADAVPQKPTHYEYALLCSQTYEPGGGKPPRGWHVIHARYHKNEMGFAAATYQNDDKKAVVIAFRGSENRWNWMTTNAFLIFQQLPSTFGYDEIHTKESLERLPKDYKISTTGHSLGAAISEVVACRFHMPAVTFESPGTRHMIENDSDRSQKPEEVDITTYLTAPNLINTLNPQVAQSTKRLYRLYVPHINEAGGVRELARKLFIPNFLNSVLWLSNQHDIKSIIKQFDPETGKPLICGRVISWPSVTIKVVSELPFILITNPIARFLETNASIENWINSTPGYGVEEGPA